MHTTHTAPRFRNADGTLTLYALACGYVQATMLDGTADYYGTDADGVMLKLDGCYHVHVRQAGVTHDAAGYPEWVHDPETGARYRADWHTFDTLTDARRFYRRALRMIRAGRPVDATSTNEL